LELNEEEEIPVKKFKESVIYSTIINFAEKDDVFGKWLDNLLNPPENPQFVMKEETEEEGGDDEEGDKNKASKKKA
jgi:hypothetical protein